MTTFNPFVMTNVQDSFSVQSEGYWVGDLQADPAARFQLAAGVIASTEALPMWGGVAVYEATPPATPGTPYMGSLIGRALVNSQIAGFATFNKTYAAPTTPQSPVPLGSNGNGYNFVRLGTNNRIVVPCSSGVIALAGSLNKQNLSWDPVNQQLITYQAFSGSAITITSITWSGGVATVTATAHGLNTNDYATISGAVPVGYNVSGAITKIDANTFTIPCAINPGTETTPGVVTKGLGGLSVTLIDVDTNSVGISYNSTTGFATWSSGVNAAVIQI